MRLVLLLLLLPAPGTRAFEHLRRVERILQHAVHNAIRGPRHRYRLARLQNRAVRGDQLVGGKVISDVYIGGQNNRSPFGNRSRYLTEGSRVRMTYVGVRIPGQGQEQTLARERARAQGRALASIPSAVCFCGQWAEADLDVDGDDGAVWTATATATGGTMGARARASGVHGRVRGFAEDWANLAAEAAGAHKFSAAAHLTANVSGAKNIGVIRLVGAAEEGDMKDGSRSSAAAR